MARESRPKDLAEHLRLVNFTLLVLSVALLAMRPDYTVTVLDNALRELQEVERLAARISANKDQLFPLDAWVAKVLRVDPGLEVRYVCANSEADRRQYLKIECPRVLFGHSIMGLVLDEDREGGVVRHYPRKLTIEALAAFWDELHDLHHVVVLQGIKLDLALRFSPQSLDHATNLDPSSKVPDEQIRALALAKGKPDGIAELKACVPTSRDHAVSLDQLVKRFAYSRHVEVDEHDEANEVFEPEELEFNYLAVSLPSLKDRNKPVLAGLVRYERKSLDALRSFVESTGEEWRVVPFGEMFPVLQSMNVGTLTPEETRKELEDKRGQGHAPIQLLGVSLPHDLLIGWALPLIVGTQFYFLVHLGALIRMHRNRPIPEGAVWIALYKSGLARILYLVSVFVLPISAASAYARLGVLSGNADARPFFFLGGSLAWIAAIAILWRSVQMWRIEISAPASVRPGSDHPYPEL